MLIEGKATIAFFVYFSLTSISTLSAINITDIRTKL